MRFLYNKILFSAVYLVTVIGCSRQNPVNSLSLSADRSPSASVSVKVKLATFSPVHSSIVLHPALAASLAWPGNLEMVRSTASGQLEHLYWAPGNTTWTSEAIFGSASYQYENPAMCIYTPDKIIQVLAREGNSGRMRHFWRSNSSPQTWYTAELVSQGCSSSPAMICNRQYPENLEVVVREQNHLKHLWRDRNYVWQAETPFAINQTVIQDPYLVQTADGNLHVLCGVYEAPNIRIGYWKRISNNWSYIGSFGENLNSACGYALTANLIDNSLEAIVGEQTQFYSNTSVYRCAPGGSQFQYDDILSNTGSAFAATTLNNVEFHMVLWNEVKNIGEHWKIIR